MLATMKEVEKFGLTPDVVDDLTGKKLGRASSGTFRTADVVGLDTMAHVVKTLQDNLNAEDRSVLRQLRDAAGARRSCWRSGNLGQKTKAGFYKKVGRDILRFDLAKQASTCPAAPRPTRSTAACSRSRPRERLKLLRESEGAQGQFLWAILRDSFHYAAVHLATIAESARDVDFAMRWGFGMKQGPFELWQEAGWTQVATVDPGRHRRRQGAVARRRCPQWVFEGPGGRGRRRAHARRLVERRRRTSSCRSAALPVHARQLFPESVLGANAPDAEDGRHDASATKATCASGRSTARC